MNQEEKRLKKINHRQWEIEEQIKLLKKESKILTAEKMQILGYHKIEHCKTKYKKKGNKKVR